jgi:hypothetical protein
MYSYLFPICMLPACIPTSSRYFSFSMYS